MTNLEVVPFLLHIIYQLSNYGILCTVSESSCTVCRRLVSGVVQKHICKYTWTVKAVSNFRRPTTYPSTLLLMIAWISSLSIMALRITITSVNSALVLLLNKPKRFFKTTSFDKKVPKALYSRRMSTPDVHSLIDSRKNIPMSFNSENSAAPATTTLVDSAVTRSYSYY